MHGQPPKKRLVVNYKGLDKLTKKFRYPLPLIETMFDHLHSAEVFTKIDLRSAYNLLRIREGDEWKTAFRTKLGLFEYQVMPFGLANAPAYFQRFVNDTFADMKEKFVVIYLDDFLIYSPDEMSHREHVRAVLQRLRENQLYAKAEKCQFSVPAVKFLGYHVSAHGRRSDEDKVKAVREWPTPRNRKEVQRFIGLANYLRKFVDGFAKIALPLNRLFRKKVPFVWSRITQEAFVRLKHAISSTPVLLHVNQTQPLWIETDASDFALGCVLMQKDDKDRMKPCAFYSRGLEPAEINYSTHDKELLAIKVAFEVWRHYLEGAPHQITVISDHQGLEHLADAKVIHARHARWHIFFKRFDFVIRYRPGKKHNQADALSRRPDFQPKGRKVNPLADQRILGPDVVQLASVFQGRSFTERIKRALRSDAFFQEKTSWEGKTGYVCIRGILYYQGKLYVPEGNIRLDVLKACHDSRLAGHFGQRKTLELLTRSFWWPAMESSVKNYCETCNICLGSKSSRHQPYGLLMPLQTPERPWSSISMDFIVELPESARMTTIFVVVDRFTKMVHFVPTEGLSTAEETAEIFINHILRLHGIPTEIVSDRGPQFVSRFWKRMLHLMKIKPCLSSGYHPQTDGQTERMNQTLEQYLRSFVSHHQDDWCALLPLAEFACNNTVNASTKLTPFFALTASHPRFELLSPPESIVPAAEDRVKELQSIHAELKGNLEKAAADSKKFADEHRSDEPELEVGQMVWLDARNIRSDRPCPRLDWKKLGPFRIAKKISRVAYELDLPPHFNIHRVFHVSLLEPAKENEYSARNQLELPPPMVVDGQEEYW